MPQQVIRLYVIPAKPLSKIARPRSKNRKPDLAALNRHAASICRDIFSSLASLDPGRIRKKSSPRERGHQ